MNQIHEAIEHIYDMALQTQKATDAQLSGVHQVIEAANTVSTLTEQNVQRWQRITCMVNDELGSLAMALLQAVERFTLPVGRKGL